MDGRRPAVDRLFLLFFKLFLSPSSMRLLFVAFAISFCALLWVAFSVARHILRHDPAQPGASGREPDGEIKDGNRL
jgi:hypothetical protein